MSGTLSVTSRTARGEVALTPFFDVEAIRADFPILQRQIGDRPLVYLDSAATSQKPVQVLDAVERYYRESNSNVHRGAHTLGSEATELFEGARRRVAAFIDADPRGLVFTRNATESLNLVASSYARELLQPGDRIVLTLMEHHSNLVPWQLAAERAGLDLAFIGLTAEGRLDMEVAERLLQEPTKLLAVVHQSNVLGTVNPIRELAALAHRCGALIAVDACQSVPHMPVSVRELDVDFLAFSGHKACGPMGGGVLWARPELLDRMPPFLGGGSMIQRVELERSTWAEVPNKFEAGTPDVASAHGLAAACDYLDAIGRERIHAHEQAITGHLIEMLDEVGVDIQGPREMAERGGAVSFTMGEIHPHDIATIVDREGVAIRAGHHCCQPLMRHLGTPSTARASVYLYTTHAEIDALAAALHEVRRIMDPGTRR
ncbi:MAG TPA: cysteine desulfurase [Candidatus Dormibacteraeota bacterium]|jgi:cysteine desulfurase/selenocysteine lyase|nr:cysteine desulfurase [Candidatus Dormibacteraeota bacterium]